MKRKKKLIPEISDKARSVGSVQEMTIGDVIVSKQLDGFRHRTSQCEADRLSSKDRLLKHQEVASLLFVSFSNFRMNTVSRIRRLFRWTCTLEL